MGKGTGGGRGSAKPRRGTALDVGALLFPLLLALTVIAPLQRGLYFPVDREPFQVLVGCLLLVLAVDHLVRGRAPLLSRLADWGAAAFALGYGAAYHLGPVDPYQALLAAERALLLWGWYWLAASVVRGRARLLWLAATLYGSGVLLALLGCLAAGGHFAFPGAVVHGRILSTLQYSNAFGAVLVASYILGLTLAEEAETDRLRAVWQGIIGAGQTLVVVTLLGTASRGAWLVFPVAAALWWLGLAPAPRRRALVAVVWSLGLGLLLSHSILHGFFHGGGGHALAVLAVAMIAGAALPAGQGWLVASWERQRFTPEVRRLLQGVAVLYGVGVLAFLLLATGRAARALAGGGLVSARVATRAASISTQTPNLLSRVVMWENALRLIAARPLAGYGGGGWASLYHRVQSGLYWSTQAHEGLLQAWLGGGAAAAAGLLLVSLGLAWYAWRGRGLPQVGGLCWGLGLAAVAILMHSTADFDLSLPAVAMIVWGVAGALRTATAATPVAGQPIGTGGGAVAGGSGPEGGTGGGRARSRWHWPTGVFGACSALALALLLLLPSLRLFQAGQLGWKGAQAMSRHQYAASYAAYGAALRLEPLAGTFLADRAQLLSVAYRVNRLPATGQQAADAALAAVQFDPGNLRVRSTALQVLLAAHQPQSAGDDALALLAGFPLDTQVYGVAGGGLVAAAGGELQRGSPTEARRFLVAAAGMRGRLRTVWRRRATPFVRRSFPRPTLGRHGSLAVAEADAMLGHFATAHAALVPLMSGTRATADMARCWLAVVEQRQGHVHAAALTFAPLAASPGWLVLRARNLQWTGFASALRG